jgi:NitT/TauT family transport system permease protein
MSSPPDTSSAAPREGLPPTPADEAREHAAVEYDRKSRGIPWPVSRLLLQVALVACVLLAWEYLPQISWLSSNIRFLDPFFISSPSSIAPALQTLVTGEGAQGGITMWPFLWFTVRGAVLGTVIGLALGAVVGLLFSNSPRLSDVITPFIIFTNTVPRVALIPIFVLVAGPTLDSEVLGVVAVVFFLTFFSAWQGGKTVSNAMIQNAELLGASPVAVMRTIRFPVVLIWTFATIPSALSFGLLMAVTFEVLAGLPGMGNLLQTSMQNVNSAQTFAVIVVLCAVGLIFYIAAQGIRRLLIRWE